MNELAQMHRDATEHPDPNDMAAEMYRDGSHCESVPLDVKRTYFAQGVAAERARLAGILRTLDKGDYLQGRLRALVAALE
jgi:hypothetical protein